MHRRSDPHPEILQLVENKTGTPDLVSSAISQSAEHAGIAKPGILAAALPRRTGPVNSRHWLDGSPNSD
jgi:hypothetical protein